MTDLKSNECSCGTIEALDDPFCICGHCMDCCACDVCEDDCCPWAPHGSLVNEFDQEDIPLD